MERFLALCGGRDLSFAVIGSIRERARSRPHEVEVSRDTLAQNIGLLCDRLHAGPG